MLKFRLMAIAALTLGSTQIGSAAQAQSDWIRELEAGCNGGNGQDCSNLGGQLSLGAGESKDLPGARRAFEKGCTLKSRTSCAQLYKMLALGEGGPPDKNRAAAMAQDACGTGILSLTFYLKEYGLCTD